MLATPRKGKKKDKLRKKKRAEINKIDWTSTKKYLNKLLNYIVK